jgi:hypothetical protein
VTGDHTPGHCPAPNSSNRSTSVNPSLAARRIARPGAAEVGADLRRGEQVDKRRAVPGNLPRVPPGEAMNNRNPVVYLLEVAVIDNDEESGSGT